MDNQPGIDSHSLGKYLSMRGRTSTNVIESVYEDYKGDSKSSSQTNTSQSGLHMLDDAKMPAMKSRTSIAQEGSFAILPGIPPASKTDVTVGKKDNVLAMNPHGVPSQEVSMPPVRYRVHGKDATRYAMRALGNVNTLFNRYGFDEKES